MPITNKIEAIKVIRAIGYGGAPTITPSVLCEGQFILSMPTAKTYGLKEAKDLVEDIMAFGVRQYLDTQRVEQERLLDAQRQQEEARKGGSLQDDRDDIRF